MKKNTFITFIFTIFILIPQDVESSDNLICKETKIILEIVTGGNGNVNNVTVSSSGKNKIMFNPESIIFGSVNWEKEKITLLAINYDEEQSVFISKSDSLKYIAILNGNELQINCDWLR